MITVTAPPIAIHFAIDLCAAFTRRIFAFENQKASTTAEHQSFPVQIEWLAVFRREVFQIMKIREDNLRHGVSATHYHRIDYAVFNQVEAVGGRVCSR